MQTPEPPDDDAGRCGVTSPTPPLEAPLSFGVMRTLLAEVLTAWRRAERLAAAAEPGTPEHRIAVTASERLRDLYHDLTHSGVVDELTDAEARELIAGLTDPFPVED